MASSYMNTQRGGSMSGGPTAELYGRQPPSATTYGGRTQAPSMRRFAQLPHLQWLWEGITAFWSWAWWLTTLPWQALGWVTPGFLQPARTWVEGTAAWWLTPPLNAVINVLHGAVALADDVLFGGARQLRSFHSGNMRHFWVAFEAYARLIQHKAHLVEKHGFDGIWMSFQTKTV